MKHNRLYVMVVNLTTGEWFGLDRCYRLLVERGSADLGNALFHEFNAEVDHQQTESSWFPSEQSQAPEWAWKIKDESDGVPFIAYWFVGKESGVSIGAFVQGWGEGCKLASTKRVLA
jgi:hypothetical protein